MKSFICDTIPLVPMSLNSKEKHVCELSEIWLKNVFVKFHKESRGEKYEEEDRMMVDQSQERRRKLHIKIFHSC